MKKSGGVDYIIFSDVHDRDGIGIEVYLENSVILEIFRDDGRKIRSLKTFDSAVSIDLVEAAIGIFRKEIPSDFCEEKTEI